MPILARQVQCNIILTVSSTDHQNLNSSCLKAKNEMLATLSLSTWSENVSLKHNELSRRKSCHTGFGIMALKKKEGM